MLSHILKTTKTADDLSKKAMSGQPIDSYSAWHAPPSTSVTGTSELFSSTFAMLSDNPNYPDQWSVNKQVATQAILFEQPQIQPVIGNSYDPPVRFDPPYAYRQQTSYVATVPAVATQPYYNPRHMLFPNTIGSYSAVNPFYSQTSTPLPQTQPLLMTNPIQTQVPAQIMRPEPLRPGSQKSAVINNNGLLNSIRSSSNSSTPPQTTRQTSAASAISPSDDASLNSPAMSGSAASGTPPLAHDAITDEEGNEERVMCMACRGVYPSRRSLTGHIGRNEKCREIIGRNYLDAVASGTNPPVPGTDAAIKSGAITTGQDGMSPVCPYCDRFISHYKGNIRRHINQCCKNTEPIKRAKLEPISDGNKNPKKRRKTEDGFHQPDFNDYDNNGSMGGMMTSPQMSPPSSSYYGGSDLCSPNGYSNGGAYDGYQTPQKSLSSGNGPKRELPPPDDAYICEDCDFVTVYKGNMKRHLNTCHPLPDVKNLKELSVTEWDNKLESMRASNMGIVGDRLQEKLAMHKQNSSRGRKPRKKKEILNSEESEPMIEEFKPRVSETYTTYAQ